MAESQEFIVTPSFRSTNLRYESSMYSAGPPIKCNDRKVMKARIIIQQPIVKRQNGLSLKTRLNKEDLPLLLTENQVQTAQISVDKTIDSGKKENVMRRILPSIINFRKSSTVSMVKEINFIDYGDDKTSPIEQDLAEIFETDASTPEKQLCENDQKYFSLKSSVSLEESVKMGFPSSLKSILKTSSARTCLINPVHTRTPSNINQDKEGSRRVLFAQQDVVFRL